MSDIIKLNVGGTTFSTLRETLTWVPDSVFTSLLSDLTTCVYDETGAIFLDRDPEVFGVILNYLRTKKVNLGTVDIQTLRQEAEYYRITPIIEHLHLDEDPNRPLTRTDDIEDAREPRTKRMKVAVDNMQKDRFVLKESNKKNLRQYWYIWWANNDEVKSVFVRYVEEVQTFFKSNHLNWEEEKQRDILYEFLGEKNEIDTSEVTTEIDCELIIFDKCFEFPVYLSREILNNHKRNYASCSISILGFQHIFKQNMIDTSEASSSSSCDDLLTDLPKRRKIRTCQQALFINCGELLEDHMENSHRLRRPATKMDILIFCENSELCKKISKHLGLIFLDYWLYKSEIGSYNLPLDDHQKNRVRSNINSRLTNANAKLYDLLQSIVVKKLVTGHNNIGLTCNKNILKHFGASVKCFISVDVENPLYLNIKPYLNMVIKLNQDRFVDYISAVGRIIDESFNCTTSIAAVYRKTTDGKYQNYSVRLPVIGIIPMYVVHFFACKKAAERKSEASLF